MNRVRVTVFNATFNNISAAETRVPGESHKSLSTFITCSYIKYTSPWAGFDLTNFSGDRH